MQVSPACMELPGKQRNILLQLMSAFSNEKFTSRNVSEVTGLKHSSVGYYLLSFVQRGILKTEHTPKNINFYSFSGEVHGIFEASGETGDQTGFRQLPPVEKLEHDPLNGAADAG